MAITIIGPPLAGIRGTIGGVTYSANGSGTYARAWSTGSNPRTSKQSVIRGELAAKSAAWLALTPVQKAAWSTFAALPAQDLTNSLGETYSASGFNWFCKCNVRLDRLGRANITAVPTQARPAAPTVTLFRITPAGSESDLCVGGTPTASTENPANPVANAFDDNTATFWSTLAPNITGWVEYQFLATQIVRKYRIWGPPPVSSTSPKDWTFEYWDGGGWQIVDTQINQVLTGGAWNTYPFTNSVSATRWRINISANNGHVSQLTLFELEMYNDAVDASAICYPQDEFVAGAPPDYDLVLHVAMHNTTGAQVEYPGFYQTLVTQTPNTRHEPLQTPIEAVFGTISTQRAWFARLFRQTTEGLRSSEGTARTES